MRYIFFTFFCFLFLYGEIIEIQTVDEMLPFLEEETLFIFDIDNTIMEPTQTLGSDQWFYHRKDQYLKKGYSPQEALESALAEWMSVQNLTRVKLVEEKIAAIIASLQHEKKGLIGLTTRGLGLATRTIEQLHSLKVDLSLAAPISKEFLLKEPRGVLYRKGILFTAGAHKGKALATFLAEMEELPKKILFINDKRSHIAEVEEACLALNIPFVGLRYGYLDEKVAGFSPQLAEIQWSHFGKILSDEEATSSTGL